MNRDDIIDQLLGNKSLILMFVCVVVIVGDLAIGGAGQLQRKFADEARETLAREAQLKAETIYKEQGCIAQAISSSSKTSNFLPGDQAIDPLSITPQNPNGTPVNSGYVCSSDGSILRVESGRINQLVGTSPLIRYDLVRKGFADEAQKMKQHSQFTYGGGF